MTITSRLQQAHARLAQAVPHADTLRVATISAPTEGGWGEQIPGGATLSAPIPCHASRLEAKDVVIAGMDSSREVWKIVCNRPNVIKTTQNLVLTLDDGQELHLSAISVSGVSRTVILADRSP